MKKNKYRFIQWSCKISPNVLDWIRSFYFSLLGSSMLTFCLKVTVLSPLALFIFALGVLVFSLALFVSIGIANSFKRHEKNYDGQDESYKKKHETDEYYYNQEIDIKPPWIRNIEHSLLYFIWIPAFTCIFFAGFFMENKSSKSSSDIKDSIQEVKLKVEHLDSAQNVMNNFANTNRQRHDSIQIITHSNAQQEKQIDSLKTIIKSLLPQPNKNKSKK